MDKTHVIANGFELPPYFPKDRVVLVNYRKDSGEIKTDTALGSIARQFPLSFQADGLKEFVFPIDPFIGMSFRNIIVKRHVAKGSTKGSIKERWSEDDTEVSISGVLIGKGGKMPQEALALLQQYCQLRQAVKVTSPLLNKRGIYYITIESLELPHTQGAQNQAYSIKASSDDIFEFLKQNPNDL